jgi:hypothetical protein
LHLRDRVEQLGIQYLDWLITRDSLQAGMEVPHSMRRASRLPASITFRVLGGRLSYNVSRLNSQAQPRSISLCVCGGCRSWAIPLLLDLALQVQLSVIDMPAYLRFH